MLWKFFIIIIKLLCGLAFIHWTATLFFRENSSVARMSTSIKIHFNYFFFTIPDSFEMQAHKTEPYGETGTQVYRQNVLSDTVSMRYILITTD